jgi:hypothetical protein
MEAEDERGACETMMTIYPNVVLETLKGMKYGAFHPGFRELSRPISGLLHQAVAFNFEDISPDLAHHEFGCDLYRRGMFTLPYPVTAFCYKMDVDGRMVPGMSVLAMRDQELWGLLCAPVPDETGRFVGAIPTILGTEMSVEEHNGHNARFNVRAYPIIGDDVAAKMWGDDEKQRFVTMDQRMGHAALRAMAYTVMLMSNGIEAIHSPAPSKLNAAREKRGKPPIQDRYTIKLTAGSTRRISLDDGSDTDITGHTRNSPRPHWRRGHFRTLPSGRVVPVAPSVIGTREIGHIKRPTYHVGNGGSA